LSNKEKKDYIKPLPEKLIKQYRGWKFSGFLKHKDLYQKLSMEGQKPSAMIISCVDSRVQSTQIFDTEPGDFFIHRNIANLVPPYDRDSDNTGTAAALEFAVCGLKVSHIIILGHSGCGGIKNGYHLCKNDKKNADLFFVNKWLSILKPAFSKLSTHSSDQSGIEELEKTSIKISIDNLIEFPFIKNELDAGTLSIHGLWHDIASGNLEMLDPETMKFKDFNLFSGWRLFIIDRFLSSAAALLCIESSWYSGSLNHSLAFSGEGNEKITALPSRGVDPSKVSTESS